MGPQRLLWDKSTVVLFPGVCLLESMQSRKPPSQELGLGKYPAAFDLQVIYPLLWVCSPRCTKRVNPAAFPKDSAEVALTNLCWENEVLQWCPNRDLWGPCQAETRAMPWGRGREEYRRVGGAEGDPGT